MKFVGVAVLVVTIIGCGESSVPDSDSSLTIKNGQVDLSVYGTWKDGRRRVRSWSDAVGEPVVAEGLAWGVGEKGLGQRVILDHAHVYVQGEKLPNGRLVRVIGVLRLGTINAAPEGYQGYGEAFKYFYIEASEIESLDQVQAPRLAEPTGENAVEIE